MKKPKNVHAYIISRPKSAQPKLIQLRQIINKIIPHTTESISYGMPCYKFNGQVLTYFGGFKDHVSLFPRPKAIIVFKKELKKYQTSKGTIQFALDKPLPLGLIKKIIRFNLKTYAAKREK